MKVDAERNPSRASVAGLVGVSGVVTAVLRFLATRGFNNDHFVHLSAAQQMLFGDWPTRDFIDIGRPLTIATSAAAQYLLGRTLLAEAILVSVAFGIAAAFTAALVADLTESAIAALGAVAMEVLAFPRSYSYPKILITALALWSIARYIRRPTHARQVVLALVCTIGFLFRHDLGVFAGIGALTAVILGEPNASRRERVRAGARFAALVILFVAPYLLYVQLNGGLANYITTTIDANNAEAGYVWPNPFAADASAEARLLYLFHLMPVGAVAVCLMAWRRAPDDWRLRILMSIAIMAVAENFGLMRDLLKARVPDAVVPIAVLTAWLAWRGWTARTAYLSIATAVAIVVLGYLVVDLGSVSDTLDRAGLTRRVITHPSELANVIRARSAALRDRFGSDPPSRVIEPLTPFFLYLDRCTTEQHRLFLAGMIPEVAYYARRPFAGGAYEHYHYASEVNQRRVVARLEREVVPFALIPSEAEEELNRDLSTVASHFRERYQPVVDIPVSEDRSIHILVDSTLHAGSRDAVTGWPCFVGVGTN